MTRTPAGNIHLSAIGADICQHRLYLATHLWFSGLTVGRIVKRKTKSSNFILSTIGRADIASNIPTAPSGAVVGNPIWTLLANFNNVRQDSLRTITAHLQGTQNPTHRSKPCKRAVIFLCTTPPKNFGMTTNISIDSVCNLCLHSVDKDESFAKSNCIKGIYVWGYQAVGQFIPLYVGKSRNIHERILQHYRRFHGGEYIIPDIVFKNEYPTEPYSIDASKCFLPTSLKAVYEMLNDKENISNQHRKHILNNFRFTFLKLDDKAEREIAEKYVSDQIGKERLISSVPILNDKPNNDLRSRLDNTFYKHYKTNLNQNSPS